MDTRKSIQFLALLVALTLALTPDPSDAKKPDKPGGGSGGGGDDGGVDTVAYDYVDLLGFENGDLYYQSAAKYVLNRDENGAVMILGDSFHRYEDPIEEFTYQESPAIWSVASDGTFAEPLDLGTPASIRQAESAGFNASGVTVVRTKVANEQYDNDEYIFPSFVDVLGTGYQELPAFVDRDSRAYGINSSGTIVGYQNSVGCFWQLDAQGVPSEPTSLGDFIPKDINDFGVMAGLFWTWITPESVRSTPAVAWFDEGGQLVVEQMATTEPMFDAARVEALNNRPPGDPLLTVVGETNEVNSGQGYGWRPFDSSQVTLIGTFNGGTWSRATDVNASGEIVGYSETRRDGLHAFIYRAGVLSDLNDLTDAGKYILRWANGINDDGDIVGHMRAPRPISEQHGFLLRSSSTN